MRRDSSPCGDQEDLGGTAWARPQAGCRPERSRTSAPSPFQWWESNPCTPLEMIAYGSISLITRHLERGVTDAWITPRGHRSVERGTAETFDPVYSSITALRHRDESPFDSPIARNDFLVDGASARMLPGTGWGTIDIDAENEIPWLDHWVATELSLDVDEIQRLSELQLDRALDTRSLVTLVRAGLSSADARAFWAGIIKAHVTMLCGRFIVFRSSPVRKASVAVLSSERWSFRRAAPRGNLPEDNT